MTEISELVVARLEESIATKQALLTDTAAVIWLERLSRIALAALRQGRKVIFVGNGGSFADSIHLAAEFVGRFQMEREPLAAIALGANNSILTAVGNDYHFEHVFLREIKALGHEGDVLICLSTSGNSANILAAAEAALVRGLDVFGLTGIEGGKLSALCPCLKVPSAVTARIQEAHITVGHILCEIVEHDLFARTD